MNGSYFPPGDYTSGLIVYRWRCAGCGATHAEKRRFSRGMAVWVPSPLPAGWNKAGDSIYCPAHRVETFVDHKRVGAVGQ